MTEMRFFGTLPRRKVVALTVLFLAGVALTSLGLYPAMLLSAAVAAYLWIAVKPWYAACLTLPALGLAFLAYGLSPLAVIPMLYLPAAIGMIVSVRKHLYRVQSTLLLTLLTAIAIALAILIPALVSHGTGMFTYLLTVIKETAWKAEEVFLQAFHDAAESNPAVKEMLSGWDDAMLHQMFQTVKAILPSLAVSILLVFAFLTTACYRFLCVRMHQGEFLPRDPDPLQPSAISAGILVIAAIVTLISGGSLMVWAVAANLEILLVPAFAWYKISDVYYRMRNGTEPRRFGFVIVFGLLFLLSPVTALEIVAVIGAIDRILAAFRSRQAPPTESGDSFFDGGNP